MEMYPIDMTKTRINAAFGFGDTDTVVKSKKQQTKDKNQKMIDTFREFISSMDQNANQQGVQ